MNPYDRRGNETASQTRDTAWWIITELNVHRDVNVKRAMRFTARPNARRPPNIKVDMENKEQVEIVFQALRRLRRGNPGLRGISLAQVTDRRQEGTMQKHAGLNMFPGDATLAMERKEKFLSCC